MADYAARIISRRTRRGAITVELALALPLLLLLLMGIMEVSLLVLDVLSLQNAAREAVRAAALGRTTAQISAQVNASVENAIPADEIVVALEKRADTGGGWGAWAPLGNISGGGTLANDAATGDQVRVHLTYAHPLVTRYVLGALAPEGTVALNVRSVSLRM